MNCAQLPQSVAWSTASHAWNFAPSSVVFVPCPPLLTQAAEAIDAMPSKGRGAELVVVVVLSLLLIAGAGAAQLQQNRHTIPD